MGVGTLTTGFDAPHVDCIAVLRATKSASLFPTNYRAACVYAKTKRLFSIRLRWKCKRHELEIDLFEPKISATKKKTTEQIEVECPYCHNVNEFAAKAKH